MDETTRAMVELLREIDETVQKPPEKPPELPPEVRPELPPEVRPEEPPPQGPVRVTPYPEHPDGTEALASVLEDLFKPKSGSAASTGPGLAPLPETARAAEPRKSSAPKEPAQAPPARPPYASPVFIVVVILWVLLLVGAALLFGTDYFDLLFTSWKSQKAVSAVMATTPSKASYEIRDLKWFTDNSVHGNALFAVTGTLTVRGKSVLDGIRVRATIMGRDNTVISEKVVVAGNQIDNAVLRNSKPEEIDASLSRQAEPGGPVREILVGETLPFMAVFFDPPERVHSVLVEAGPARAKSRNPREYSTHAASSNQHAHRERCRAMKHAKRTVRFSVLLAFLAAAACVFPAPVFAEEKGNGDEGIPAYAISRLKVLAGTVWVKTADTGDWAEATTNTPLTPNSRVSVPEGSEAELQFHGGQFVLFTAGTDVEIQDLADDKTSFRLRTGEIRFDLPGDDFAPVGVRVPGGARASFAEPGRYWLTVTDEDTTRLVVRRGKATVSQEGEKHRLEAGQQASIGRTITVGRYQGEPEAERPREAYTQEEQNAGVPPVVTNELRDYGDWVYVQSYGYAWRPRVAAGWSPNVYGRWAWVSPYGWTWVSYEPWGWYPYHSGYWVNDLSFGWVWSPYGSLVSVGFVWGSYDYYHHHPNHYHHNYRYHNSNARFIPEGRNVRWEPMRPGERYRRPEIRRDDVRVQQYNRPLESGRVFVAPRSASDPGQRQWRDVNTVRSERQNAIRTMPAPAGASSAPKSDRGLEKRPSGQAVTYGTRSGTPRVSRRRRSPRRPRARPRRGSPRRPEARLRRGAAPRPPG